MQDRQDILAADARLAPFAGRRGWQFGLFGAGLTLCFVLAIVVTAIIVTARPGILAISNDFRVFWAAGRLALSANPLAVFNEDLLSAEHGVNVDAWMPWLYPPGYLLMITPFGAMSFSAAFILSTAMSIGLIALAMRPFVAGITPLWIGMTLAPAYAPALILGQNSLFWMAGLLAALAALRSERWVLAGIFIGCLTLKPQLGLMIPFALLAIGAWRTILAAIATTVVISALPTLVYGVEYWPLLIEAGREQSARMMNSISNLYLMVSPFYLLSSFGLDPKIAIGGQWVMTAASGVSVFLLWRSPRIGFDAKAAGLVAAILLSSPYLWYYEAAMMVAVALFLVRSGILALRVLPMMLFLLLWAGGVTMALNTFLDVVSPRLLGAMMMVPLLIVSLGLCLRHLADSGRSNAAPA